MGGLRVRLYAANICAQSCFKGFCIRPKGKVARRQFASSALYIVIRFLNEHGWLRFGDIKFVCRTITYLGILSVGFKHRP